MQPFERKTNLRATPREAEKPALTHGGYVAFRSSLGQKQTSAACVVSMRQTLRSHASPDAMGKRSWDMHGLGMNAELLLQIPRWQRWTWTCTVLSAGETRGFTTGALSAGQ